MPSSDVSEPLAISSDGINQDQGIMRSIEWMDGWTDDPKQHLDRSIDRLAVCPVSWLGSQSKLARCLLLPATSAPPPRPSRSSR